MGHHTSSDDSSLYRPKGELELWSQPDASPVSRMRKLLEKQGAWDQTKEDHLRKSGTRGCHLVMRAVWLGEGVSKLSTSPSHSRIPYAARKEILAAVTAAESKKFPSLDQLFADT